MERRGQPSLARLPRSGPEFWLPIRCGEVLPTGMNAIDPDRGVAVVGVNSDGADERATSSSLHSRYQSRFSTNPVSVCTQ
jgi:hypothetical protein